MNSFALTIKKELKADRQTAIDDFLVHSDPILLMRQLSDLVDRALIDVWNAFEIPESLALVAVGGFGRAELCPFSDVDLLFLLENDADEGIRSKLEQLISALWDLGLDIGHSTRTIEDCLEASAADITVQTALLETRLIYGNHALFKTLKKRYSEQMDARAFFRAKTLEMRQRHIRFESTPFSLEPNCKESPGGLRDLQVILWVAKAARLGKSWRGLARVHLLTAPEARQLATCDRILKEIRIRLHLQSRRREDRLVFDLQVPVAEAMGFSSELEGGDARRIDEQLLQRYYRAAKAVTQLNTILSQNIEANLFPSSHQIEPINARFNEVNGLIDIASDNLFEMHPSAILESFLILAENANLTGMTARTLRALWHGRLLIDDAYRENTEHKAFFLQIMQSKQGVVKALQQMNQTSVLGRFIPAFHQIVGQMQHDLFHIYTVDQHILTVMRNVHRFSLQEHAHEFPFCSQLMATVIQPWLLYLAALFHDIAKGRKGDHSLLGKVDAAEFCQSYGLSEEDEELVVFLVEHHLLMSNTAQKKDLTDVDTIREFAKKVKDERHLRNLYLLTVADIQGTSPHVWSAWKSKLLEDLFQLTVRYLGGDGLNADSELKHKQTEAIKTLRLYGLPTRSEQALWGKLDIGYFLRHDASDIAWQTRKLYSRVETTPPTVHCRLSPIGEGLQVMVYVQNQADLFTRLCSYFDNKGYSILDAKIHTTNHGYALDTFLVTQPRFANNYRDLISLIEHEIAELLTIQSELPTPTTGRVSRMSRSFPITPSVNLRPDARKVYYVLTISANDRTGLLYAIANTLSKYSASVQTAKVVTMGERVDDTFLIDCPPLKNERTQIQLETELLDILRV